MELSCRPCPALPTLSYLTLITILWGGCYSPLCLWGHRVYVCPGSLCYTALERTQHINSRASSRIQASFLHGDPHPGLPPGSLLQDLTFRSIPALLCFSLCVRRKMSRNHIPQTHLLAACRHRWEISWQRSHLFIPWSGSFRPPQSTVSQQLWRLPRWQEWESVPLAVSSCVSVSAGMWAWTRFAAAFWSLGSPLCSFPLVSIALVANFLW